MGNQNSRSMTYHQYYESLKNTNPNAIRSLNLDGLDPYQVLGVRKNFTFDELKESYRNIARMVHPDKGGSDQLFQLVTNCFRTLAQEYKLRTSDRPHWELKQDSERFFERQMQNVQQQSPFMSSQNDRRGGDDVMRNVNGTNAMQDTNNFLDKFNKMFDENKLDDDEKAFGYSHMMAPSSKKREDINVPKILNKFNKETFNKTFDSVTLPTAKDVVVYKEPEALPLARKIQYTELGADKPSDYSSGEGTTRNTLQYTDYMVAHTTSRLVDPRAVKERKNYKNVEQYESDRASSTQAPMTEDERVWMEQKAKQQEMAEQMRLQRLQQRDNMIAIHHEKMNRLMLGGNMQR